MGKLVSVEGEWATYEYYPDYYSHESKFGIFKVKPASLLKENAAEFEITSRVGTIQLWYNRPDEHVVFALMNKIKKAALSGNPFPERVYHNA